MKYRPTQGFTLIELAIVLVIIGLLVGGVLVGRDLIKAAELRGATTQISKTDAAATTFRLKYNGLPGDLAATTAAQFGFSSRPGWSGNGDGDGIVYAGNIGRMCCEPILFWTDLSMSQLISDNFTGDGVNGHYASFTSSTDFMPYVQHLRMRSDTFMHVVPYNGRNYYMLWKMNTTNVTSTVLGAAGLSAYESWQIDSKIDDGMPLSGTVLVVTGLGATGPTLSAGAGANASTCVLNTTTPLSYYTAYSGYYDIMTCELIVRTSF